MIPKISVVIGFRDWGLNRLHLAATSILRSFNENAGEVILSDYGSSNPEENKQLADELGLGYVYSEAEIWSRSRALNAGFAIASGDFLVSTDADMVFSPRSFEIIGEYAARDPHSAFFLQCRDLPEGMDDEWVQQNPEQWEELEKVSRLRPRWGMGGMMAISREGFLKIRGFDERLHTYGGEDLDFAKRARRAGYRTRWVDHPEVRMYHMWHPPTINTVNQTEEGTKAVEFNRHIVYKDTTFVRNIPTWEYSIDLRDPLVTVAICTQNRSDLIGETIKSVLAQTMQDFEIIVVDDGGEDDTKAVVESFGDNRLIYHWQEQGGISKARNTILDLSRGQYTAVIDDDDLMHPKRLEWHLKFLHENSSGNVGSFVNFDDESGELKLHVSAKPAMYTTFETGAAPGHGTWFVETDILRKFRYDETITSGVDNNLMLRMLRSGVRLTHTGKPVTLRRMHPRQVTVTDSKRQGDAALQSLAFLKWEMGNYQIKQLEELREKAGAFPKIGGRDELLEALTPYLPDHLVTRDLVISGYRDDLDSVDWDGEYSSTVIQHEGTTEVLTCTVANATYDDIIRATVAGAEFEAHKRSEEPEDEASDLQPMWIPSALEALNERNVIQDGFAEVVTDSESSSLDDAVVLRHFGKNGAETLRIRARTAEDSEPKLGEEPLAIIGTSYFKEF